MAKPPSAPPNTDIGGAHRDEPKIQEAADDVDGGAALKQRGEQTKARPDYSDERSRDDRS